MKKVMTGLITGLFLFSMASIVNAAIIAADLEWLSFHRTWNKSWNEVNLLLEPGGTLEGWRYATRVEIESLYTAVHPGWVRGEWSTANEGITDEVAALLGYTTDNGSKRSVEAFSLPALGGFSISLYRLLNYDRYAPANTDFVGGDSQPTDSGKNRFGYFVASYLVRDIPVVPLPASVWLLASGFIGLVGFRRKFRKA